MSLYQTVMCMLGKHDDANYQGKANWCDHCGKTLPTACEREDHLWKIPDNECCGYRYGIRVCVRCDREERLMLRKDGTEHWWCMEERLEKVTKKLKGE